MTKYIFYVLPMGLSILFMAGFFFGGTALGMWLAHKDHVDKTKFWDRFR